MAAVHLPDPAERAPDWIALECLRRRIKTDDRIAGPVAHPYQAAVVDVDGVRHRPVGGYPPFLPFAAVNRIARQLPGAPFADPELTVHVAPHTARALSGRWWIDRRRLTRERIDLAEVAAGE